MPLKKGGGNKLQYYDESTGQYDDQKIGLNEIDKENLVMYHYFGLDDDTIQFHFPYYLIHDFEYCDIFCKCIRKEVNIQEVKIEKCQYLLEYKDEDDKSSFLQDLGYNIHDIGCLKDDIIFGTDLNSILFAGLNNWGLKVIAKTILKNKIVTSVWMVNEELGMRFVTLIPGGDKRWKK